MRDPKHPKPRKASHSGGGGGHHLADKLRKHSTRLLLLWFILSVYLFLSATPPAVAPLRPVFLLSMPRALSAATASAPAPPVRIYIYDLLSRFNRDWVTWRCMLAAQLLLISWLHALHWSEVSAAS